MRNLLAVVLTLLLVGCTQHRPIRLRVFHPDKRVDTYFGQVISDSGHRLRFRTIHGRLLTIEGHYFYKKRKR